ncbi:MAG: hypothetical protein AUG06_08665 [Actinobacteria bacterium 13_1_20CM_2_65_11]|nr:MAG: hypothetical protein AUH40_05990 [Chloroflexi bacterium 13_1_40CM_65_17]OLE79133.1 MAG: hypothetical protein AUG06_08665 [Actinobacteria bacterium 13_1_20CM_2_65_11]
MRSFLLKLAATVLTLGATAASAAYVTSHVKNPFAPLQPTVLASQQQGTVGGLTFTPGVRQGDVQPVTSTYAS